MDVDIDQVTGNVYVFLESFAEKVIRVYNADGVGPIAEFGDPDFEGTIATSPAKFHRATNAVGSIAVNDEGVVYLFDKDKTFAHRLMIFKPKTPGVFTEYEYGGEIISGSVGEPRSPVLDDAGNVYTMEEGSIEQYTPTGASLCKFEESKNGIKSLTVNPASGEVFYSNYKDHKIHLLGACSGGDFAQVEEFSPVPQRSDVTAMAVNPTLEFGSAKGTGDLSSGSATVTDVKATSGVFSVGQAIEGTGIPTGTTIAAVGVGTMELSAAASASGGDVALVAQGDTVRQAGVLYAGAPEACPPVGSCPSEANGQSSLGYIFAVAAKHEPVVESESVAKVRPTSATLNALINPKGAQTTYVFQYMTDAAYKAAGESFTGAAEAPLGGAQLGSGQQPLLASVTVSGLAPGTEYRYRVIAASTEGSDEGPAQAFRTFPPTAAALPDGRAFELVSPVQKNGGEVIPGNPDLASCGSECKPGLAGKRFPALVSSDGDSVAYQGSPFAFREGAPEYDEYVSTRSASGWTTTSLSPPIAGDAGGDGFRAFSLSSSLGSAIVYARNQALVPETPPEYPNFFLEQTSNRDLSPLLTNANATLHRSPGDGTERLEMTYAGASSDYSRQFFEANDALTIDAVDGGANQFNLYEWAGGQLQLVNEQPGDTETIPGATFGSGLLLPSPLPAVTNLSHAISADGSRVYWTGADGKTYLRLDGAQTLEVPGPGTCKESVAVASRTCFLTAAADGSEVLLSNGRIYQLNEETVAFEASADLTGGEGGFQGIAGQSEDLAHVYFVLGPAKGSGDLTSGSTTVTDVKSTSGPFSVGQAIEGAGMPAGTTITAVGAGTMQLSAAATATGGDVSLVAQALPAGEEENSAGDKAQLGGFNLYSWQSGSAATTFVATLLDTDNSTLGVWSPAPPRRSAEASSDGSWLAFSSKTELTGVDSIGACEFDPKQNKYVLPGPCQEVFLYDSSTGQLTCPSCNPGGAAPLGASILSVELHATGSLPQPRYLTNSGRLYFDSRDALSSLDTNNGVEDVYQFEPQGIGSCAESDGCVSLISSGSDAFDANFLTMDPSGANVFFTTRNRLLPADTDQLIDLYDARVGGGVAEPEVVPPCQGEGCQPPSPLPPAEPTPSSSSTEGPGNVTAKPGKHKKNKKKGKKHKSGKKKGKKGKSNRGGSK